MQAKLEWPLVLKVVNAAVKHFLCKVAETSVYENGASDQWDKYQINCKPILVWTSITDNNWWPFVIAIGFPVTITVLRSIIGFICQVIEPRIRTHSMCMHGLGALRLSLVQSMNPTTVLFSCSAFSAPDSSLLRKQMELYNEGQY